MRSCTGRTAEPRRFHDGSLSAGHPRWITFSGVVAVLFCCMLPQPSPAQVVLLVERASVYQQAARGFQQAFAGADRVEQIFLDSDTRAWEARLESFRRNPPRLVVAIGTQAARTAKERLPNVPILYCLALRPAQNELLGPNIGGVALDIEAPRQFDSIRRAFPQLRRIGVVYDELTSQPFVRQAQDYFGSDGVVARSVRTPQQAAQQIKDLMSSVLRGTDSKRNLLSATDAFWLPWDSVTTNPANFRLLVELSLRYNVPLIAPERPFVEAGALISVGADYEQAGRQAGVMAQQVLRSSARPGDFVAVPPTNLVITINGEVARRLGIAFPPDLRADVLSTALGARAP